MAISVGRPACRTINVLLPGVRARESIVLLKNVNKLKKEALKIRNDKMITLENLTELIKTRRSIRKFQDKPVP